MHMMGPPPPPPNRSKGFNIFIQATRNSFWSNNIHWTDAQFGVCSHAFPVINGQVQCFPVKDISVSQTGGWGWWLGTGSPWRVSK